MQYSQWYLNQIDAIARHHNIEQINADMVKSLESPEPPTSYHGIKGEPAAPQPSIKQEYKIGWKCPKCGAINSPSMSQCTCNKQELHHIKCEYTNCNNRATFKFHIKPYPQFGDMYNTYYCCNQHLIELLPTIPAIVTKIK